MSVSQNSYQDMFEYKSRSAEPAYSVWDRYERLGHLGSGAYGDVYKAQRRSDGFLVAIKTVKSPPSIPPGLKSYPDDDKENHRPLTAQNRMLSAYRTMPSVCEGYALDVIRELTLLKSLRHVNLISLVDVFHDMGKSKAYMVMEYCPTTLQRALREEPQGFEVERTRRYIYQILEGLRYCHGNKVAHRDLKPENILITDDDTIKVADFGLGRVITCPAKALSPVTTTISYRAPEIFTNYRHYTVAVDMWSAGCVFAEMVRGRPMFQGGSEASIMMDIRRKLGDPRPTDFPENFAFPGVYKTSKSATNLPAPRRSLAPYVSNAGAHQFRSPLPDDGINLLEAMLCYDMHKRIGATTALTHPFFKHLQPPPAPPSTRSDSDPLTLDDLSPENVDLESVSR
ncbi:kinase-like domain-containing protein [Fimicolochytrium jonesii]|uniref:kinase-like domain-containing protein n=1 Tax=Fimicolochytrium jonesii TaxID=1396493 RepID=UPI0022FEE8A4|nr:kinase-like domain-containing protein [Fimicolochytrium jonesii]KAI8818155.1 kinase-like domain-containing protein [Fimicolochytrium jonesii]